MQPNSQCAPPRPHSRLRLVIFASALVAGLLFLVLQLGRLGNKSFLPVKDFVEYWAAGRLFAAGGNPYSWDAMLELEKSVGMETYLSEDTREEMPLLMFNPPWTLVFVMPFGQASFALSRLMWFVFGLGLVILCADVIWRTYGGAPNRRWLAWIVGLSFVPTLQVLQMGQIGPLLLLGIVGFLFCIYNSGWSAGVATVLIAIKPHLFGVFDRECHRLFLIDVLTRVEGGREAFGVQVLWRGDQDCVDRTFRFLQWIETCDAADPPP